MSESKQKSAIVQVHDFLHTPTIKKQLTDAFPASVKLTAERFVRQALTLCSENPKLLQCTQRSLIAGMMRAAELGLQLNGVLGQAYLIPYYNSKAKGYEATFQVGYRGLIDLSFRSGRVAAFPLHTVYEKEPFEVHLGTTNKLLHTPLPPKERGEPIGYYGAIIYISGGNDFQFLYREEVEDHMRKYAQGFDRASSPWQTAFEAMAQKTAAKKLCKRAPLSPETQQAALLDDYGEQGLLVEKVGDGESSTDALDRMLPDDQVPEPQETAG